jgi:hypothetical protein
MAKEHDSQPRKPRVKKAKTSSRTKPKDTQGALLGKDEMNLVEHPFAMLWKNDDPHGVIYNEWEARHPINGRVLKAWWRVSGDSELGLPTASDERVYLVLMALTREAGFDNQAVSFIRHDLLDRLGWAGDPNRYKMLEGAFARLKGVTISAQNAFWDPKAKSFSTVGFNMIDSYQLFHETPGAKPDPSKIRREPRSWFKWSDVMFESFQNGNIRSVDLHFALSLKRPLSLRLFRYLDKKAFSDRATFEIALRDLCKLHLNMAVEGRYDTKLKAGLRPAHDELIERGFLQAVSFAAMKTKQGQKVRYTFPPLEELEEAKAEALRALPEPANATEQPVQLGLWDSPAPTAADEPSEQDELLQRMLGLKVSPAVADELLQSTSRDALQLQLDCLDDREPRSQAATFVKAVREGWEPPPKYLERLEGAQEAQERAQKAQAALVSVQASKAAQKASESEREAFARAEAAKLEELWAGMTAEAREHIEHEAKMRLGVLGVSGRAPAALDAMRRTLLREWAEHATATYTRNNEPPA